MTPKLHKTGYIGKFKIFGIDVFVHWTFVVVGMLLSLVLADKSIVTALLCVIAYSSLVLLHELGHAYFVIRSKLRVHSIVISGGGGFCFFEREPPESMKLLVYGGGILFQIGLLLITLLIVGVAGEPHTKFTGVFFLIYTVVNALLIIGNLIPQGINDGARIWQTIKSAKAKA